jgi:glycosyltransferase involved in cell wall biosynthesis
MKISVVTVCFNSEKTIRDTIESVFAQSHPDVEYIIVDGCSRDATMDIVRSYGGRISRVLSEPDRGIYDAMNKGLQLATGDVVGFLNSDDCFASVDSLSWVAQAFDDTVDAVYADLAFVDRLGQPHKRFWRSGPYQAGACPAGWAPPHPTLYIRRGVLHKHGGFRAGYRYTADFELALRLFEVHKIQTRYFPRALVNMRLGGATTGNLADICRANLEASKACKENGYKGGGWFIMRKLMRKVPQLFIRSRQHHGG